MSKNSRVNVPEARDALANMKYEIARELGVNLKQGYNCLLYTSGDLPACGHKPFYVLPALSRCIRHAG